MNPEDLPIEDRTECEIWSRAMGYFRPISFYNIGKQQEHRDRKFFTEGQAQASKHQPADRPKVVTVVDPIGACKYQRFDRLAA
jgi:hypothetical protein